MLINLHVLRHALASLILLFSSHLLLAQETILFRPTVDKAVAQSVAKELDRYGLLEVDAEHFAQLTANSPEALTLSLPAVDGITPALTLSLERHDIFRHDFRVTAASGTVRLSAADMGSHYVGTVAGQPDSRVTLSLLEEELTATITQVNGTRLAIGRAKRQDKTKAAATYLIFPDAQLAEQQEFDCGTADSNLPYSKDELHHDHRDKSSVGCIDVYLEVDHDIFLDKGSVTAAAQHLAANFNEVAILYDEIGVGLKISTIKVWDRVSPYDGRSSGTLLRQFQSATPTFNGDLAQLVSYQASGGIAVLDGLCHPYEAARMSFSSIASNYQVVPTYSWSTMVIAHELGHLMGSQHTHACVWNGNDTAIDGCAGITEGSCGIPGVPADGGTIMSYCHLRPEGINFFYGFGPQPSAVIANRVRAAQSCVQAVCGINPPPPPPPSGGGGNDADSLSCDDNKVIVQLVLDDFGMESTWRISAETGEVLSTGGPYPKKQKGRIVRDTVCIVDGCYVFEILDEHGDGLCCNYGNGAFSVIDSNGVTMIENIIFDTLALADFCIPFVPGDDDDDDNGDCDVIDFSQQPPVTYGTNQDAGTVTVIENNRGIRLMNNAWKGIEIDYTVTENTWISFWFRSPKEGEVHGIGMDNNAVLSANYTFRLYGYQRWGLGDFNDYSGNGEWQFFQIPIGQFYTLEAKYLFFTADHDVGSRDGVSEFRDVVITEGTPCEGNLFETEETPTSSSLQAPVITPNPAATQLSVALPDLEAGATFEVLDLNGRRVMSGALHGDRLEIPVKALPNGTYLFRYQDGKQKGSQRFIVAH